MRDFVEIDQEVAAADQVQARERRIACHVLPREDAQVANVLRDPVLAVLPDEETLQALGRDVLDAFDGYTPARAFSSAASLTSVPKIWIRSVGRPSPRYSTSAMATRIDLLAGRAAGHPDADAALSRDPPLTERGKHLLTQRIERGRIAKELGDANQEVLIERGKLAGIAIERFAVVVEALDPSQHHSPLDAPLDRGSLVVGEVDAVRRAKPLEDVRQGAILVGGDSLARRRWPAVEAWCRCAGPPAETRELPGNLLWAQHEVDTACLYRMPRHCREARRFG